MRRVWTILALAPLLAAGAAAAEIHVGRDEHGRLVATNAPPGVYAAAGARPAPRPEAPAAPDEDLAVLIEQAARRHGLSPWLLRSVVAVESAFDHRAVSSKGARGLMQLMPATAADYGVDDVYDPRANLEGGARHLRALLDLYDGDLELALAAYNAGTEAVRRHGGIPPYRETREYVRKVLARAAAERAAGRRTALYVSRDADGTLTMSNVPGRVRRATRP